MRRGASERESLAELVARVTLHNPESGLCAPRGKARGQRDLITVFGILVITVTAEPT